ncbi:MAG: glutaminyl-peptide cyclotransferase [Acidobacteriaceae bacterium]|jgi:glutamine cyclotransferase|nr:glutaminyl-peptide cyclotransferase [Acidobacteriaceae bacterium]
MKALALFLLASPLAGQWTYQVVNTYPHDREAFTQGLEYRNGFLYEGTGLHGRSTLRKVKLETGIVLQKLSLPPQFFGEGISVVGDRIVQLTWQSETGFIWGLQDFKLQRQFTYRGEGWGLTTDGRHLYFSDGTDEIRVLDSQTLAETRRIRVRENGRPLKDLNELEWVEGEILANVWQTDRIVKINPLTGRVTGSIDLTGILPAPERAGTDVLNGIAYDAAGKRLFVTGKLWPKLFHIRLVKK